MKTIGLLGGMSWESTASYYAYLNRAARERLGGVHSAPLLLWSVDFHQIAALQAAGDWTAAGEVLAEAARRLEGAGAEAILICANTMHIVADRVRQGVSVPVIDIIDATAARLRSGGLRNPLLLATRFTMEMPFYREGLARSDIHAVIADQSERDELHRIIYEELVQGRIESDSRRRVAQIGKRLIDAGRADSVVLGCTEFALLVGQNDFTAPVLDTTRIHCDAAAAFAFGE